MNDGSRRLLGLWRGVRFRITMVAVASVAVVLTLGGFVLLRVQKTQLLDNLDATLSQRADDLESADIDLADPPRTLANLAGDDAVVQIVGADGRVLAASANAVDGPLIGPTDVGRQEIRTVDALPVEDDEYRVLSRPVELGSQSATIHIATNTDDVRGTLSQLRTALLVTIPIASALIGVVVWILVGRTLRPVESIRRRVAAIDGSELGVRVPTPGTDDEIDRLAHTMNDMLARQEHSVRAQQQFVADASHELRTPIARMRTELDTSADDLYASLSDDVDHLGALVDDLLHLASVDAGRGEMRRRAIDLDDIVLDEAKRIGAESSIGIDARGVSAAHLTGDPSQLRRLVRNLLENAVRHARSLVVVVLTESAFGDVLFVVSDDGEGIQPDDVERIFERFVRLDLARQRDGGGTGLGLAIAQEIVLRHHGTIVVETADTGGARFVVAFPAQGNGVRQPH